MYPDSLKKEMRKQKSHQRGSFRSITHWSNFGFDMKRGETTIIKYFFYFFISSNSDAFTHGPTGPGPRGPLGILDLGGPEQILKSLLSAVDFSLMFELS